jgi:hypothetical protein
MRIGTDKLIVKALHAIEDACWSAQGGPVAPTYALRFVLAFLFENGDGRRETFDEFWRVVTDAGNHHHSSESIANTVRGNNANREAYRIYRAVGVNRSTEMMFYPAVDGKLGAEKQ